MSLPIDTTVKMQNGIYRSISTKAITVQDTCPDHIRDIALKVHELLDPTAQQLSTYEISAQTVGSRKTEVYRSELANFMLSALEEHLGVDTSQWDSSIGVLRCRSASYHNDPYNQEVAYINWYVDGPPALLHLDGNKHYLEAGSFMVFDPMCPHALTYHNEHLNLQSPRDDVPVATFITLEVPMIDVAHLLGVKPVKNPKFVMDPSDPIDPQTGTWIKATKIEDLAPAL